MKKVSILAILVMAFAFNMQAQKLSVEAGVSVGFIDEVTIEGHEATFTEHTNVHYSFAGGLTYEQKLLGGFSVVGGAHYIVKGMEYDLTLGGEKNNYTFSVPYAELQILPKYNISFAGVGVYLMAGPYFAQRLGGKIKGGEEDIDCDDILTKKDYGVTCGVGCRVRKISLTAKYDFGLSNIMDIDNFDLGSDYKTQTGMLVLGYTF